MSTIKKTLKLNREDFYKKHLLIINHILPKQMTPKEAEVLAAFMSLTGDLSKDPFSTSGRKIVRNRLNLSAGGLGNYLDTLKDKKFIIEKDKIITILPVLIPLGTTQEYQFKLEVNE